MAQWLGQSVVYVGVVYGVLLRGNGDGEAAVSAAVGMSFDVGIPRTSVALLFQPWNRVCVFFLNFVAFLWFLK